MSHGVYMFSLSITFSSVIILYSVFTVHSDIKIETKKWALSTENYENKYVFWTANLDWSGRIASVQRDILSREAYSIESLFLCGCSFSSGIV
jgi:hypothetical protein